MNEKPMIPAPQYTWTAAIGVALALGQRALAEVRTLARMPGPSGQTGPEGKRGMQGERGEKGERGEPGKPGAMGAPGTDGKPGERGQKGEPGRNATDLTLVQDYIEQRFQRMIEAMALTTPDGGRTLIWSLGGAVVREIKTALVLDCGVWKEGETYEAGDGVSFGGSFFIAQTDTTTAKPGKSDEWRLAVKRGGDYRPEDKRMSAAEPIRFK
jgi:collagen type III alpha